jgi:hypothetical protein
MKKFTYLLVIIVLQWLSSSMALAQNCNSNSTFYANVGIPFSIAAPYQASAPTSIAPGLTFNYGSGGFHNISGVPTQAGTYNFTIPYSYRLVLNGPIIYCYAYCTLVVNPHPLQNFSGEWQTNNKILLKWTTSSEVNSKHFLIEKSTDGQNFTNLGSINAAGQSNTTKNYQYVDSTANPDIKNYYRLSMINNSLTKSYSKTIEVAECPNYMLSGFSGKQNDYSILLNWITSFERNTNRFILEKSIDGQRFNKLDSMSAAGQSTVLKNYQYTDKKPDISVRNYYRLTAIDNNGNAIYANTVVAASASYTLLKSFEGYAQNDRKVLLQWKTEKEHGGRYFIIEKSTDKQHFTKLGEVTTLGESNVEKDYQHIDSKAILGKNYYRLLQVGKYSITRYSEVIEVNVEESNLYPNPNSGSFTIAAPEAVQEISIIDMAGHLVKSYLPVSEIYVLPLHLDLRKGVYVVKIKTAQKVFTEKLVIQ